MLYATATRKLDQIELLVEDQSATTVVAVSGGYPEAYKKGKTIKGLPSSSNSTVFHAGTTLQEGEILTNGGRVLAVTSLGDNHKDALLQSYQLLEEINFEGMYYRKDIGFDL
jgi:phosphoribosylamine--glycine ligase